MKPLKLTMQAFGTYSKEQVIDFSKLEGKSIFVITGKTGAGKTTIFDAICYALYGEASGSSKEKDTLRSDFASDEVTSFVELEFQVREKKYYIKREPKQIRKKQRGTGTKEYEPTAELQLPSGKVITGVKSVDEEIRSIMGIDKNQFKQIVMLPQGEFRKLLEANSIQREEILRKIFGTDAFLSFQNKLKEKKKNLFSERKALKDTRGECISSIKPGDDEILSQMIREKIENTNEIVLRTQNVIENDELLMKEIKEKQKKIIVLKENIQKDISLAEMNNKKLSEREELKNKKQELEKRANEFVDKENKVQKGRKSLVILEVEKNCIDKSELKKKKGKEYENISNNLTKITNGYEKSKIELEKSKQKETEKNELKKEQILLESFIEKVIKYEKILKRETDTNKECIIKHKQIDEFKNEIDKNKKNQTVLLKQYSEAIEASKKYIILKNELDKKEKIRSDLRKLYKVNEEVIKYNNEYTKKVIEFSKIEKEYKEIKYKYENMDTLFRKGQAGILASKLVDNMPCPVCGSLEHPSPASLLDEIPSEEQLKEIKMKYENIQDKYNNSLNSLSKLKGKIDEIEKSVETQKKELGIQLEENIIELNNSRLLDKIKEIGIKIANEIENLIKELKLNENIKNKEKELDNNIKQINEKIIPDLEKRLSKANDEEIKLIGEYESLKTSKESIEKEIPENIRTEKALMQNISKITEVINKIERQIKLAQDNHENLMKNKVNIESQLKAKKIEIEETEKVLENSKQELIDRIKEQNFVDYKDYVESKMEESLIEKLDKEIRDYSQELNNISNNYKKILKETDNLLYVEINKLNEGLDKIKVEENSLSDEEKIIYSRYQINQEQLKKLKGYNKRIDDKDEKLSVIEELTKVATGDNPIKMSFERYVLAAYFDDIIRAANQRLNLMTGGRFFLRRKLDKSKGNSQQGLEIEILDNYTGKYRNVNTVSGGEGFKASLSLALGLADVVQSNAGGINLETMFIDEGFGTLDPESLDNAIQTLLDLQKGGRIVGIISHVPELKERIEVRLEVTQTKEGSFAEFNL